VTTSKASKPSICILFSPDDHVTKFLFFPGEEASCSVVCVCGGGWPVIYYIVLSYFWYLFFITHHVGPFKKNGAGYYLGTGVWFEA
jgi:hypothetical protein